MRGGSVGSAARKHVHLCVRIVSLITHQGSLGGPCGAVASYAGGLTGADGAPSAWTACVRADAEASCAGGGAGHQTLRRAVACRGDRTAGEAGHEEAFPVVPAPAVAEASRMEPEPEGQR